MRLWVVFLLFCIATTVLAGRNKVQDDLPDADEEDDKPLKPKPKATKPKSKNDEEDDIDDDPGKGLKKGKKPRKQEIEEEEDDDGSVSYAICNRPPKPEKKEKDEKKDDEDDKKGKKKGAEVPDDYDEDDDDEACYCEMNDVTCDHVTFQDETPLSTLLLEIADKDFVPLTFRSSDNEFRVLEKGQIIPSMKGTVREIDLSRSRVMKIKPGAFSDFTNLTVLKLSGNNLQNLDPRAFEGNPEKTLHRLYLNQNNLTQLKPGVFSALKELKLLDLDFNRIKITKELFEGLTNLEELSLDFCHFGDSMDVNVFDNLENLKVLSMRGNRFSEVPKAIQSLKNLEILDISENKFSEIHEYTFKKDQSLKVLYMTKSKYLWSLDECAFCDLPKLEEVHLSNSTQLYNINKNAFGNIDGKRPKNIKKVDFSYSNISTLDEKVLPWGNDIELLITGNPLNCSCDTAWLLEGEIYTFVDQNLMPRCNSPNNVRSKPLPTVKQTEVCSVIRKKAQGGRFLQAFVLLLLASLICFTFYYLVTSGKLMNLFRQKPGLNLQYSNLSPSDEQPLERDFQPRPQDV